MNKFADMSTSQLLEIINLKNGEFSSYEDVQAARDEYISRVSREFREIRPEQPKHETPEVLIAVREKTENEVLVKTEPETETYTAPTEVISPKVQYKRPVQKKKKTTSPFAFRAGVVIFLADAFLTFMVAVLNAVLNYSLIVNVSVFASALYLLAVFFGCYCCLHGVQGGKLMWRGIALSHVFLMFMTPGISILSLLLIMVFLISLQKSTAV